MSSEFGKILRVSVFGQSHGKAIGVVVDGLPAGEAIDLDALNAFLDRRRPGRSPLSTARKELDTPVFLAGLEDGKTCGAPLCAVITANCKTSPGPATRISPPGRNGAETPTCGAADISPGV